ncbi:dentin sialophosphoprotein [Fopius arisanus]|uniref:Dentin sialophosphoprotein n=1 Tax=Fopius arisanus TaxID=64838 RepID=A0A0C9QE49_9HYME|nr:PREDICTED: dentin sialophosphoprotein-like [Fopius arisanus]
MSKPNCLICATDEGIFLDFLTYGKDLHHIIEKNLSLQIGNHKLHASKICYKCTYELTECNKFVQKFNQVHNSIAKKPSRQRSGYCHICSELGKKGFIYDIKNNALESVCEQIQDLLDHDFSPSTQTISVCLYCRYNLDVLSDLKKVAKNYFMKDNTPSELSKINVSVIKRKTTSVSLPIRDNSPNASPMVKRTAKAIDRSVSPTNRRCDKCEMKVENGVDMFRFHSTGEKVCKDCWMSMDPVKLVDGHKRKAITPNTKFCTVVLKDVLINPPEMNNPKSPGEKFKIRRTSMPAVKTELDQKGEVVYIISDESEDEMITKKTRKGAKRASSENDTKSTKKAKRNAEMTPQRATRAMSVMSNVRTPSTSPKLAPKRRHSDEFEIPAAAPKRLRNKPQRIVKNSQSQELDNKKTQKTVSKSKGPKKPTSPKKNSNDEGSSKTSRRKSYEDTPMAEEGVRKSTRIRKPMKHWSDTSDSSGDSSESTEETVNESESSKQSNKSSNSASKSPKTSASKTQWKGASKKEKYLDEEETEENEDDVDKHEDNQPYTCTICSTQFESRVEGKTHQLTHSKKLGVVLKKVSMSGNVQRDEAKTDDEQSISTGIIEDESFENSKAITSEVTKDAEKSKNDGDPDEHNAEDEQDLNAEAPGKSATCEETEKECAKRAKPADDEIVEKTDEIESGKSPEIDESHQDGDILHSKSPEANKSSNCDEEKNQKVDTANNETEKEKIDEQDASELNGDEELSHEQVKENDKQKDDDESTATECQPPVISETINKEINENEVVEQGTNDGIKKKTSAHIHDEREKGEGENEGQRPQEDTDDEDVDTNHSKNIVERVDEREIEKMEDDKQKIGTVDVERETEQAGHQEDDLNAPDDESEDERSPEAEPLTPPRPNQMLKEKDEQLLDGGCETQLEETDCDNLEKVKEVELISNGEKDIVGDIAGVDDSSELADKGPQGEINVDEASMDAIERQMETIVGDKEMIDVSRGFHKDAKESSHTHLKSAAVEEQEVS